MINYKDYDLIIGIDPGVNTGIAAWDVADKSFLFVKTTTAVQAEELVLKMAVEGRKVLVRYEDAHLREWIPKQKNEKAERGRASGAGSIKRDCSRWEEFLTHHQIPFDEVAPKNNRTKMTAETFKKLTGWLSPTNNHGRDAAALVFGL